MQINVLRPAIAMIELIFALVVMGIAMLSVPLMLDTASKSSAVAFQQESIAIIASHTNALMTYAWDEQNTQSHFPNDILSVTNGDSELDGNTTLSAQPNKQRALNTATFASAATTFGKQIDPEPSYTPPLETFQDDLDDFANTESNLTIAKAGTQVSTNGDYLDISIKINTAISYLDDTSANYEKCNGIANSGNCAFSKNSNQLGAATGTTNIKLITTSLTSSNVTDKKIVLRTFMCNIGATNPAANLRTF
ncbi:type II secretion system protein [Sulfurovum sp.]|uniref:type II secretion system protein n=1 Tax=Sulfurovum sp. TaxID=1969726 RepID=UPI0025E9DAE5|nr:type II secretion system protein [Sulfurovum sp.]